MTNYVKKDFPVFWMKRVPESGNAPIQKSVCGKPSITSLGDGQPGNWHTYDFFSVPSHPRPTQKSHNFAHAE